MHPTQTQHPQERLPLTQPSPRIRLRPKAGFVGHERGARAKRRLSHAISSLNLAPLFCGERSDCLGDAEHRPVRSG